MKQTIRIIGGQYRGKKIHFPELEGLRPTPDRVKETLFNWLMHDIRGARCLDAFAGSGALGFEAYSRGANKVVLLENAPPAYRYLQDQLRQFNDARLSLIQSDALIYLKQTKEQFDIIFLDPPFANHFLPACIQTLEAQPILSENGLVYIESDHDPHLSTTVWEQIKLKKAGLVVYALYRKKSANSA